MVIGKPIRMDERSGDGDRRRRAARAGVALIAQAWRMKDYSLNVSIARERRDDDPEMLSN
jgi:hypothetical protein